MKKVESKKVIYIVKDMIKETRDVSTLRIAMEDGTMPSFIPGQFLTLYLSETTPEGKSYSISSSPDDNTVSITVKVMGEFSHKLNSMKVGDRIVASLPYGYFYSESKDSHLIIIVGGIGIAPFRSIILSNPNRNIDLYYSNRTVEDIIFKKELDEIVKINKNIKVKYFVTRDKAKDKKIVNRRIEIKDVLGNIKTIKNKEFFICGGIAFVRDFWKKLCDAGVKEDAIYTEAFFSH